MMNIYTMGLEKGGEKENIWLKTSTLKIVKLFKFKDIIFLVLNLCFVIYINFLIKRTKSKSKSSFFFLKKKKKGSYINDG